MNYMNAASARGEGAAYIPSREDAIIVDAAFDGDLELLQRLALKFGDDGFRKRCQICRDCQGLTALHYAAGKGFTRICEYLIEKGQVDVDMKADMGETPLLLAAVGGHTDAAKYLIARGALIAMGDYKGITSLHFAAGTGNRELMQYLLSKGADIESNSVRGTPLQCAAAFGIVESVRFLLRHGAQPNSVSPLSVSPLMWAIHRQSFECLELLLKAGADPNISSFGISPLALAALEGDSKFLKSLLRAGANPNSVGADRQKPIEYAAMACNYDGLKILFPVTHSIPYYPSWSIYGIPMFFHSEKAKIERQRMKDAYLISVKQRAIDAAGRREYADAIKWCSEAIYLDSSDQELLLSRSLYWTHLQEATFSLYDAKASIKLKPDSPDARFREGVAWMLLNNYVMASDAFLEAHTLDGRNEKYSRAFRSAALRAHLALAEKHPSEAAAMARSVS